MRTCRFCFSFFLAVLIVLCGIGFSSALADDLRINEVLSANTAVDRFEDGYYDMIELYNAGSGTVLLSDYAISDDAEFPLEFVLPEVKLAPGAYYVIYCTGEGKANRCNFKLSRNGETLFLSRVSDSQCIQSVGIPVLPNDVSYGWAEECWLYYAKPTFGKQNQNGSLHISRPASCDVPSGCYSEPITVTLSAQNPIYFTTDGSDPSDNGTLYLEPLTFSENTNLRFCTMQEDSIPSTVTTCHYLFDTEKYSLPIVSVSSVPNTVTGSRGIWKNYSRRSMEAAISICYLVDGKEQFTMDCGLTLHGQGSRKLTKKSFNIRFRSKYGSSSLTVPLFGEAKACYTSLVLRCGSEDYNRTMLRDEFFTTLNAETMPDVLYQKNQPVNLFIDGEYYGIYYLRERIDAQFVTSRLGGSIEDSQIVNGWTINQYGEDAADDFIALWKFCVNHDLTNQENYEYVMSQISAESFIDYTIARVYSGDRDYPNIRHVRNLSGDGRWHIVNFDLDWAFSSTPANFGTMLSSKHTEKSLNNAVVFSLLKNSDFRAMFLERLSYHLRVTYNSDRVIAHLDTCAAAIEHDMPYECERWNTSYTRWQNYVQLLREDISERVSVLMQSAKKTLRITEEEMDLYFSDFQ